MKNSVKKPGFHAIMAAVALMLSAGGCTVGEAVVDGFYGGIADTIAGLISETLLAGAGF